MARSTFQQRRSTKKAAAKPTRALLVIESRIHEIRGVRIMLDRDLAALYGVTTGALNQAVRRNLERFPTDFMLQLTAAETRALLSQTVISKAGRGGVRTRPRAFSEQGVAMLSSVLRSRRAVSVNIAIMRAFARLRGVLATHADLVRRIDDLERRYNGNFAAVFRAIRALVNNTRPDHGRRIGFQT